MTGNAAAELGREQLLGGAACAAGTGRPDTRSQARVRSRSCPADSRSWEPACGRADFRRVGVEARVSVVIGGLNRR
jgi:hypothetical protein